MSYNPRNPFPPLSDRNERTLRAVPVNERWVPVSSLPDWYRGGACVGQDPDLMFPRTGGEVQSVRKLCGACPVREACLAAAMDDPSLSGVWGGTTEADRDRMREAAKRRARQDRQNLKRAEARAALAARTNTNREGTR